MSKKVIGALLALALVLSVFSFSVFAAGTGYETDTSYTQTWGLANKTDSNGSYTVDVVLTTNYPVGPIQFKIDGVDKVTKVEVGSGYYAATPSYGASGLVVLTPDTSSNLLGKKLSNAVVAKVTYTSASNATPSIKDDVKSASKPQGTLMAARLDGSDYVNSASFIVGQKATIIPLGGEMPAPTEADLQVKSGVTGVQINTTYTFGGQYAGVVYGFTVTGTGNEMANTDFITNAVEATDGSALTITPSKGTRYGAGATIKVGDKTYVVVVFGDANGDGRLNAQDATQINKCAKGVATATGALQMGGQTKKVNNATQLAAVNAQDYTEMNKHTKGVAEVDQVGLATALTNTVVEAYK
jgi:hypothetical protein